ncbi:hypothetical protein FO519_009812, partial [Halicephalobus sp. NKZ332]
GTLQSITKDGSRTELYCVGIFTFKREHESIVISVRSEDNSISENPHDKRELTTETLTGRYRARYDECTETMFSIRRPGQIHDRIKIHFENNQDLKKFEDCANKIIGKRPQGNTANPSPPPPANSVQPIGNVPAPPPPANSLPPIGKTPPPPSLPANSVQPIGDVPAPPPPPPVGGPLINSGASQQPNASGSKIQNPGGSQSDLLESIRNARGKVPQKKPSGNISKSKHSPTGGLQTNAPGDRNQVPFQSSGDLQSNLMAAIQSAGGRVPQKKSREDPPQSNQVLVEQNMFAIRRPGQTHDRIKIHFENNQDLKKFEDCVSGIIGERPPQNTSTTSNTVTNPQIPVNVHESFPSDSPHNYPSEGTSHRRTEATPAVPRENPPPVPLHNPPVSLQAKIPPVTPQQTLSPDGDTPPQLPLKSSTLSPNSPQQHTPPVQRIPQQQSIQEIENQEANPQPSPGQFPMTMEEELQQRLRERAERVSKNLGNTSQETPIFTQGNIRQQDTQRTGQE